VDAGIETGIGGQQQAERAGTRRLVPMQVGKAEVYVEVTGAPLSVEGDDGIYAASPTDSENVFGEAGKAVKEVVRVVGEQVATLGDRVMPDQMSVEFSLSFEAGGKARLVPVLFTGETKVVTGLKVTAVWGGASAAPQSG
jgi:hypothetical protein